MINNNALQNFNIAWYSQCLKNINSVTLSDTDYEKLHTLYTFEIEKAKSKLTEES